MYTTLIFSAMLLGLTQTLTGQFLVSASSQPIAAVAGDDVILPCQLDPSTDATDITMVWSRPDLEPDIVLFYREGQESCSSKHPSYQGRTALMPQYLEKGDISLKLSRVKLSDQGNYTCLVPTLNKEQGVQLIVGAVALPEISLQGIIEASRGIVLVCESAGWYPEPVVSWLDGGGNLLPAESTQITTGPDGLYRVTSTVTVKQTHTNTFTCRVHLKWINQSRETHFDIPEAFFPPDQSRSSEPGGCSVAYALVGILLAMCFTLSIGLYIRGGSSCTHCCTDPSQYCAVCSARLKEAMEEGRAPITQGQAPRWGSVRWLYSMLRRPRRQAEPHSDPLERVQSNGDSGKQTSSVQGKLTHPPEEC